MSLITGLITLLGSLESDTITIHEQRCVSVRNRNADCLRCADACTSGVISYRDNELTINPELCIGCGTCATACPTCAIEIKDPTDDELVKRMKSTIVATNGHPVFACEAALASRYDEAKVCVLPCLGRIDESVLVGLAAYKASSTALVCGSCETCTHAPGGDMLRTVVASAQNLLDAFGSDFSIAIEHELPQTVCHPTGHRRQGAVDGSSRRDFFTSVKQVSTQAAASALSDSLDVGKSVEAPTPPAYQKVNKEGTLSHFVPSRRTRVYNYLKHIGEPVVEAVDTRIIGAVSIDTETCNSCRMCAVFCPTGALKKVDDAETFGIMHHPSACMQCALCESICPTNALTVSSEVPIAQFIGKQALCFSMKRPDWTPNKPDSMYNKIHDVIGSDKHMCMF